jgi:hypothetical protein
MDITFFFLVNILLIDVQQSGEGLSNVNIKNVLVSVMVMSITVKSIYSLT